MKTLVIGSGGREHALAWALSRDPQVSEVHIAPGNPGTALVGTNHAVDPLDPSAVAALAAELAQRDAQAAVLAAPYRRVAGLLATLAQVRDDTVRLDAVRTTSSGAVLDARAVSYRAAARWLARIVTDERNGRIDIGELASASAVPAAAAGMPFRFSVQVRWQDGERRRKAAGGGA